MKLSFNRTLMAALVSAVVSIGAFANPASAGSWSSQGYGTTMYQTNWWYWGSLIQPVGSIPPTATISNVYWNVSMSSYPSGLLVRICHNGKTGTCGDTTSASGGTTYFSGYAANKPFQFGTAVSDTVTRMLSPYINVGVEQITVNYNY